MVTVDGTLERTAHCTVLRVGSEQWELLGTSVELHAGAAVRVRGRAAAVREGCGADRALRVTSIRALPPS